MSSDVPVAEHTNDPIGCHRAEIQDIAESDDHEFYMSALGPEFGANRGRANRGRNRIVQFIIDLGKLRETVICPACQREVERQIEMQRKGVLDIERVWDNFQ